MITPEDIQKCPNELGKKYLRWLQTRDVDCPLENVKAFQFSDAFLEEILKIQQEIEKYRWFQCQALRSKMKYKRYRRRPRSLYAKRNISRIWLIEQGIKEMKRELRDDIRELKSFLGY